jgi:hypothetical protein
VFDGPVWLGAVIVTAVEKVLPRSRETAIRIFVVESLWAAGPMFALAPDHSTVTRPEYSCAGGAAPRYRPEARDRARHGFFRRGSSSPFP